MEKLVAIVALFSTFALMHASEVGHTIKACPITQEEKHATKNCTTKDMDAINTLTSYIHCQTNTTKKVNPKIVNNFFTITPPKFKLQLRVTKKQKCLAVYLLSSQ